MDRIFFYLYNWYLNNAIIGIKRTSDDAIGLASWILGVGIGLWFLLADEICSFFFHYNIDKYHLVFLISSGLISGGVFHSHYLIKDRVLKINQKYESSLTGKNIRTGTFFSFFFIFSPLLIWVIWMVITNNYFK
jgi:hypothetical protein